METIALNLEYDYESRKKIARYLAGMDKELNQSKQLQEAPNLCLEGEEGQ